MNNKYALPKDGGLIADEAFKELEEYRLPEHLEAKMELLRAYVADVAMEEIMTLTDEMIAGLSE